MGSPEDGMGWDRLKPAMGTEYINLILVPYEFCQSGGTY
jgi:hypothetical protein